MLILNGLTQAAILFVLGSGLTLAFGLMRVVNLAHGAFYMLGGYIGYSVITATGNWLLALLAGSVSIAALGFIFERLMLARVRGNDLPETLLTVALGMVIVDLCLVFWPRSPVTLNVPASLNPPANVLGVTYPGFRLILMASAVLVAVGLWLLLYRTKLGAAVRAGVDDRETVRALGLNIGVMYTGVFVLSGFLGGLAGVLGGSYLQLSPGGDTTILMYSLVVVIVGGMGSLLGAFLSALILGQIISWGLAFAPQYAYFLIFVPMVIVLALRPQGLAGRKVA
ncbi:MAG: branched-chain amino acid ABC transporter permease [Propionicimonas sp.]|uniref:branched-chain amino acid ABC transporter permease n=1 Tax=Propionicimonas sp. TaxID=1955623 RepID=UPI002B20AE87|nr:branched-chain amino acid ABC transporter permease [Propionicimonas sp.]MEA4944875.1 branched-chain amino acid ABC transporter permease [Propionicimonas sp.]MEA5116755.1 branched-chain amino acid ABC transporter permease [Propionicimonas sp.]